MKHRRSGGDRDRHDRSNARASGKAAHLQKCFAETVLVHDLAGVWKPYTIVLLPLCLLL